MNAPNEGDRVRVAFEGKVVTVYGSAADVKLDGEGRELVEYVPLSACEVTAQRPRPLSVGDVADTVDKLGSLPQYSVVRGDAPNGIVAQKIGGDWRSSFGGITYPQTWNVRPVVLYVGGVS